MSASRELLEDIATTLDALLRVRHPSDDEKRRRETLIARYLGNEARRLGAKVPASQSVTDVLDSAAALSLDAVASIRTRCLFYGCDDLVSLLVQRRIRTDAIAREEAVLYVQDRLQRDDFRRIRNYSPERGATFVTYMWQVINNLLLDFIRRHDLHAPRFANDGSASVDERGDALAIEQPETRLETTIESGQLHQMLAEVMANQVGGSALHPLRERLRPHLTLSSKEKVFLKAMFQYDLSINEIRELPGFEMSVNDAYRFYYRIMDRLLDSFKEAGVLDHLRAEVSDTAPRVAVEIEGERVTLTATAISYLEQRDRHSTLCGIERNGKAAVGIVEGSFSKVCKYLNAYLTPINSKAAVADRLLPLCDWSREGVLTIAGIAKEFRVGRKLWTALKGRCFEKAAAGVRI